MVQVINPAWELRTASKTHNSDPVGTKHHRGQLDSEQAWSGSRQRGVWYQMDLESEITINGVVMQKRAGGHQYVSQFRVDVSSNNVDWTPVDAGAIFQGNEEEDPINYKRVVLFNAGTSVTTRYVRIIIENWRQHPSMRVGVVRKSGWHTLIGSSSLDEHLRFHDDVTDEQYQSAGIHDHQSKNSYNFPDREFIAHQLMEDQKWKRWTVVTSDGTTKIYVNGVLKGEMPHALSSNIAFIGSMPNNEHKFGRIAQLNFYDFALSAEDVAKLPTHSDRKNCIDSDGWSSGTNTYTCADYSMSWCTNGEMHSDVKKFGEKYRFPENNCCACGKNYEQTDAYPTFPELLNPSTLLSDDDATIIPVHGPFGATILEQDVTMASLPKHSHLRIEADYYDTRAPNARLADVCTVTVGDKTYAGSHTKNGFAQNLHAIDIGPVTSPSSRVAIRWYRKCKISIIVAHNKTSAAFKFGPASAIGRKASDLWALGALKIEGRMFPLEEEDTSKSVYVSTEFQNLYEDTQEWGREMFGITCVSSFCPESSSEFCPPMLPGFCDGTKFDCLVRAKAWCLSHENGERLNLCHGISHTLGNDHVQLCVPNAATTNGQATLQVKESKNSVMVKRSPSVEISDNSLIGITYEWTEVEQNYRCGELGRLYRDVLSLEDCRARCVADVGTSCDFISFKAGGGEGCYYSSDGCGPSNREEQPNWTVYKFTVVKKSGIDDWQGILMGKEAIITVTTSQTNMIPNSAHKMSIPCKSGMVIVSVSSSNDNELRDTCVVEVDTACHVKVWHNVRVTDEIVAWSALVGPGATATSGVCNIAVAADSAVVGFATLKKSWKLDSNLWAGQTDGVDSLQACYVKAKDEGANYFSYRNDGGSWCNWGNEASFKAGETVSTYHCYRLTAVVSRQPTASDQIQTTAMGWASIPSNECRNRQYVCEGIEQNEGGCRTIRGPFGGYNFGQRFDNVFENLGEHTDVRITVRIFRTHYWRLNEKVHLEVQGIKYAESSLKVNQFKGGLYNAGGWGWRDDCGWYDSYYEDIVATVPHTTSELRVSVVATLNRWWENHIYIDKFQIQLVTKSVLLASESSSMLYGIAQSRTVYEDPIVKISDGPLGLTKVMDVVTKDWSSPDTLAYRWATSPDQEATSSLVKKCTEQNEPTCRVAHGPFDVSTSEVSRTFSNLGSHTELTLTLRYWMIDSWDSNEEGGVLLNGNKVWSFQNNPWEQCDHEWLHGFYEPWRGSQGRVCYFDVSATIDHTDESVHVSVYSSINSKMTDESWAFSDVMIYVSDENAKGFAIVPPKFDPVWANALTQIYADQRSDGTVHVDGWSSQKTLAHGWGTVEEEHQELKEECDEDSPLSCKLMHGPFNSEDTGKTISRSFRNLANHTKLALTLRLWRVDYWHSDDEVFIELYDNATIPTYTSVESETCSATGRHHIGYKAFWCEEAAVSLGLSNTIARVVSWGNRPPGCFVNNGWLYFNTKTTSTVACSSGNVCLCADAKSQVPFFVSTIAPSRTYWGDFDCTEPWQDYVVPSSANAGEFETGPLYAPWYGTRGAVCFNLQSILIAHNRSEFQLKLRHTLKNRGWAQGWFGFDNVAISLELESTFEEVESNCPGASCASMECQKSPGDTATASLIGYCDPITGCDPNIISTNDQKKTCSAWARNEKGSTCVPPPVSIAPETNSGSCTICNGDFQCNRNAPFAPIHFVDPLRSNKTDPIKGRLVTKIEVVTHGSLSLEAPENTAAFQMNGYEIGEQFGVGSDSFGPQCNDCYKTKPLIVANTPFYSYAGQFNEGPGDGNNTVNFTVLGDLPWCVSMVEVRICAKPGPPQIHHVHVTAVNGDEDESDVFEPPAIFNNTFLNPAGNEWIWFSGQNFLPSVDAVTYGPKGEGYVASNCTMYFEGTLVRCLTEPGVGGAHNWKIWANGETNKLGEECKSYFGCNTTYSSPEIISIFPANGPTSGGIQVTMKVRKLGEQDTAAAVRATFGKNRVPAVAGLEPETLLFFLPPLTSPSSSLDTKIFIEVEAYKSPHGSMGVAMSNELSFTYDPPKLENIFVRFDDGFNNVFLTLTGRNFGANEKTSEITVCHEGSTADESANYTGCFLPSISRYSHSEIELSLGSDTTGGTDGGPFPGNITFVLSGSTTFLRYFGRTPVIQEVTIDAVGSQKFAADGDETVNSIQVAVRFAGSVAADISIGIFLVPSVDGGVETIHTDINNFAVDTNDQELATFDFVIPAGQGKGASLSIKRGSQSSEAIFFDYLKPQVNGVTPYSMQTEGSDILITGSNFGVATAQVLIMGLDNVKAGNCKVVTQEQTLITCRTPEGRGIKDFSVFIKAGNQHSYALAFAGFKKAGLPQVEYGDPRITKIEAPTERATLGNFRIRIVGENFGGNKTTLSGGIASGGNDVKVSIGYRQCAPIVLLTHRLIECVVKQSEGGAGNGVLVVVAGRRSSGTVEDASTSARLSFSKPVIFEIVGWPSSGMPTAGGKNLTIVGRNFGINGSARTLKIGGIEYAASTVQLMGTHEKLSLVAPAGEDTNLQVTVTVTGQTSDPAPRTFDYARPFLTGLAAEDGYPTSGCVAYEDADSTTQSRSCRDLAMFELEGNNFGLSLPTVTVRDTLGKDIECQVVTHSHTAIQALLPPGIGPALVSVSSGSTGKQRASNQQTFSYNKPKVFSVWSGVSLKSLKVSSVFDASAPDNELLFVFGDEFGETSTPINITLNGKPCSQATWNPAARDTKPQGFPYLTCKPPPTRVGSQEIAITVGTQTGVSSRMIDGSSLSALCASGFYGLSGEWCATCWHFYVDGARKYVANCTGEYVDQAWPYSISGTSEPVPLAEFHSWPPHECIENPEFCLQSFAESSGESYIPETCSDDVEAAEADLVKRSLALKVNQTMLDIYPLEEPCNDAFRPGMFCHPLRVNFSKAPNAAATTRRLCPRIESCEPKEACLSNNTCATGYVSRYDKTTFEGDRCLEGHSELPDGATCYAPKCSECDPTSHFRLEGECTPCPTIPWLLPLLLGVSIIFASLAMFVFTRMKVNLAVASIGIDYFQVLSMFSKAKVRWPPEIKWIFHQLQWFCFDVDMTGPECAFRQVLTYERKWYGKLMLPIGGGSIVLIMFSIFALYELLCHKRKSVRAQKKWSKVRKQHAPELHSKKTVVAPAAERPRKKGSVSYSVMQQSMDHSLSNALTQATSMGITMTYFLFVLVSKTALAPFNCVPTRPPSGHMFMADRPLEECFVEGRLQQRLQTPALVFLIFYVFGFPFATSMLFWRYSKIIKIDQMLRARMRGDTSLSSQYYQFRRRFSRLYYQVLFSRTFLSRFSLALFSRAFVSPRHHQARCTCGILTVYPRLLLFLPSFIFSSSNLSTFIGF